MRTARPNNRVCGQRRVNGRLKILRAANGKEVQGQSLRPEFFFGSGMVNFDEREGIVIHAHDVFALEKGGGALIQSGKIAVESGCSSSSFWLSALKIRFQLNCFLHSESDLAEALRGPLRLSQGRQFEINI